MSALGYDTFFGGMVDSSYEDDDANKSMILNIISEVDQDARVAISKNKNSYLVLIGNDINKYCFLYQPESYSCRYVMIIELSTPLEGIRRAIFEHTLIGLHIHHIIVVFCLSFHL